MPSAKNHKVPPFLATGPSSVASPWLVALVVITALLPLTRGQCVSYLCYQLCQYSGRGPGACLPRYYSNVRYLLCTCSDSIYYNLPDRHFNYPGTKGQQQQQQQRIFFPR
ncbi:uncharacterized protein LOC142590876 [Dermacentor variabilis]|uniref:uncharacterized protein LOC142590876 n=1 Tax=Dermacentor variabilis TaxID=34621 RepID=UPI003F5C8A78